MFKNSSVSYRPKSTLHTHAVSAGVQEPVQALKACTSLKKRLGAFLYNGYLKRMYVYKFEEKKFDVSVKKKKKNRWRGYIRVQKAISHLFIACMFYIEADPMLL